MGIGRMPRCKHKTYEHTCPKCMIEKHDHYEEYLAKLKEEEQDAKRDNDNTVAGESPLTKDSNSGSTTVRKNRTSRKAKGTPTG